MGMIGAKTVVAVFDSRPAAELAKATLLRAGVPENRIAVSAGLTDDGIAAEVPGQAYENQPGQPARDGNTPSAIRPRLKLPSSMGAARRCFTQPRPSAHSASTAAISSA